jgi:hypothetical protein
VCCWGFSLNNHGVSFIAFDELPDENWAIADQLLDEK